MTENTPGNALIGLWRFADLAPSELLPRLAAHLAELAVPTPSLAKPTSPIELAMNAVLVAEIERAVRSAGPPLAPALRAALAQKPKRAAKQILGRALAALEGREPEPAAAADERDAKRATRTRS